MTDRLAFFTVSDPRYVNMAPVMFESVREHYPDAELYLFMIGTGEDATLNDYIHVVYMADVLEARDLEQRLCFYLDMELATSFRPHCFQMLFDKAYDRVIYLDPDLYIFRRMTEVDDLLSSGVNGIVTPHALRSVTSANAAVGDDSVFLSVGIFNLGFLALNRTPESLKMVGWWRDKLKWRCIADSKSGLFVDQKWMEFLPIYFEGFHILRLPTYNLAPWNAEHYSIFSYKEQFYIDTMDQPVAFIHFSGVKRSRAHFKDMIGAYEFYVNKLRIWERNDYPFQPYSLQTKDSGVTWDKILTFLYKDYISETNDRWNGPLDNTDFYDYFTGIDRSVGLPRYLKKVFDLYPNFASLILFKNDKITFDNLLNEIQNKNSPYAGVSCPKTVEQIKCILAKTSSHGVLVAQQKHRQNLVRRGVMRVGRRTAAAAMRIRFISKVSAVIKRIAFKIFGVNDMLRERDERIEASSLIVKLLMAKSQNADYVK